MAQPDGVTSVAKEQAGEVGRTAADAGGSVAQTTKEQASNVVGEAKAQARDLVGEARGQARQQANTQKGRAVEGLRALGGELDQMGQGQSGIASEVARQAAQRAHALAEHLDRNEPADLLEQVRLYARRRPVVFLAGAALAGVLAGRLTRGLASANDNNPQQLTGGQPAALPTGYEAGYDTGYDAGYVDPAPSLAVPPTPVAPDPAYPGTGYAEPAYGDAPAGYDAPTPAAGYPPVESEVPYQPVPGSEPPARGYTP